MALGSSKTAVEMIRKTDTKKPRHVRCRFYCKVRSMDYGTSSQIVARHLLDSYVPQPVTSNAWDAPDITTAYLLHTAATSG